MATDKNINQLVINKLTKAQYAAAQVAGQIVETELYMLTDDDGGNITVDNQVTQGSENPVSGGAVYEAIAAIPTPDVSGQIEEHNTNPNAHADIRMAIENIEDFIIPVTEGYTNDYSQLVYSTNVTFEQILEAYNKGKNPVVSLYSIPNGDTYEIFTLSSANIYNHYTGVVRYFTFSSAYHYGCRFIIFQEGGAVSCTYKNFTDASSITSGTLSSNRLPTVPVAKGGTGATDAATARANLGITAANIGALTQVFSAGTSAPSNTNLLWVDTTADTGGLKYYNGSAWVHVPVAFT
jgi:hypothetical protein